MAMVSLEAIFAPSGNGMVAAGTDTELGYFLVVLTAAHWVLLFRCNKDYY